MTKKELIEKLYYADDDYEIVFNFGRDEFTVDKLGDIETDDKNKTTYFQLKEI